MDFKLSLKRSLNHWTEPIGGVKFKLKYPSIEQGKKIEGLDIESFKYTFYQDGNETKAKLESIDSMKYLELKRYCIKVWIEDWEGMTENGQPVKCELENNELKNDLWWGLVQDIKLTDLLFEAFKKEIEFSNTDKKK